MKKISLILLTVLILSSCADSKRFVIDGEKVKVEPYGWANKETKYNDKVVYEVNFGNVVWSVIGFETIIVPIWLTGWEIYEPVRLKTPEELGEK